MTSPCPKMHIQPCQHLNDRAVKGLGGSSLLRTILSCRICHPLAATCLASWNSEKADSSTGNSLFAFEPKCLWPRSGKSLVTPMPNSPDPKQQETMSIKKTPEWKAQPSNSGSYRSTVESQPTGMKYENSPLPEPLQAFPVTYLYVITMHCEELAQTTYDQLVWSELFQYFGVELELGSHVEPGKKRVWKLTLKTPTANFGMVTKVTDMLSLMNFAEESQSVTYLDGSIGIQSLWKSKDPASPYVHARFGSPPM